MNRSSTSSEISFHELPASKSKLPSIRKQVASSLRLQLIVIVFTKQPSAERYLANFFHQYFCELLENSSRVSKYVQKSFRKFTKNHPSRSLMLVKLQAFTATRCVLCKQGRYKRRTTIFIFSFCIRLVTQLNGSALGVLKHHYISERIRELLIGNSRFLIYNSLNQLLYYTIQKKVPLS